ncbi:MAG: family 16 glycoside hydrolase [Verrucomicrobiota bacterium]
MNHSPLRAALVICTLTGSWLSTTTTTAAADSPATATATREAALIAVLQSNAAPQDKAITCKRLAICGSKAAVPALAALLSDEKLASWARIGLEAIPDPAVDAALREAANSLQGKLQVGVINSLGMRRDALAVAWLTQKLKDPDAALMAAAAAALGRIGGEPAAHALGHALAGASATTLPLICDAYLRNADQFLTSGNKTKAAEIFSQVRGLQVPRHIRMEATRGLIVARQPAGIPLLIEQLKSDDAGMVAVALGLAHELPGTDLTQALSAEVLRLPPEKQVYVIEALGARLDKCVVPTLLALTKDHPEIVSVAAIAALAKLADPSVLPRLVQLAVAPDAESAKAAQSAIAAFPMPQADASCIAMLAAPDAKGRLTAADIISRRACYSAMPAVAKAAREDADAAVRVGCINTLRELGSLADLTAVTGILVKNPSTEEAQAAEKALATICGRQTDHSACAEMLVTGLAAAQPAQKCALLRLLRSVADAKALQAIRSAMSDPSKEVKDAATRLLCEWSTADASPDLLALAKTSPDATYKLLALRGFMRISGDKYMAPEKRMDMCKQAAALVQRDDERKILLGVLTSCADADSLAMAASHLDNPALQPEACLAGVAIAERLLQAQPDAVLPVMEKVLSTSKDAKLLARAKTVLSAAQAKVPAGVSLFNGKDLTGWDGAPGWWKVEDGALTAESTAQKPCTACNYLIWKGGQPADFELTCDFKLSVSANSGVQIRSETRPNWDTFGYQADMTGDGGLVGFVYHHQRGLIGARGENVTITADGKKEVGKIGDAADLLKVYKRDAWNTYRIICRGPNISLFVNGALMCQITDNDAKTAAKNGIIALQMHPGPPMKVQFKNLILKEFK